MSPGFALILTVLLKAIHKGPIRSAAEVQAQIDGCASEILLYTKTFIKYYIEDCINGYIGIVDELNSFTEGKNGSLESIVKASVQV